MAEEVKFKQAKLETKVKMPKKYLPLNGNFGKCSRCENELLFSLKTLHKALRFTVNKNGMNIANIRQFS